jgi:hypothetical protein
MKPSWEELASIILTIKGYWADVIDLIAKGVEYANKLGTGIQRWELSQKKDELKQVNEAIKNGTGLYGAPQVPEGFLGFTPRADLKKRAERLKGEIDSTERGLLNTPEGPEAPKVSRGVGAKPTLKKTGNEERDPLDVAIDASRKHTATLEAEAKAIDDTAAAQARAKIVAQLEESAKRANTAAGKEGAAISEEQRKRINEEADAVERAAAAYAKKQVESQIKFDRGTAFLSQSDVAIAQQLKGIYGKDIPAALNSTYAAAIRVNDATKEISNTISTNLTTSLVDVIDGTKTAGQAFQNFSKVVIRAIEEAIVKLLIVGPLMRGLQSGSGGILGFLGIGGTASNATDGIGGFGPTFPGNAGGTDSWRGGMSWVGEHGPELLNIPRGAQVVPNDILRSGGGGDFKVTFAPQIDARGADVAAVSKIAQVIAQQQAEFEPRVRAIVAARGSKRW